jgi:hypothetical protein
MANALYPTFKEALLNKEHDLNTDAVKASLLDGADESYAATDNTYVAGANGIADAAKVAASGTLQAAATIALGVFDTANFTWSAVTGDVSEVILLWNDGHASDGLIAWYDTGVTGFPVTPNGGDINVTVHASGWFSL